MNFISAETNPFELRAGELDVNALQVLSFRGRERINDVYSYEVTFATDLSPKSLVAAFGDAAALTLKTSEQPPRILQGIAAHLEALGGVPGELETERRRYSLTIVPKLWLLKHRRKNRVFQNKTPKEIIESLLRGIGIPSEEWRWRTQPDYPKLPFVYQRNESDYEFFRRVLASAGIFFYFEHPSKDGTATKLNFGDGAGHTVAVQGSLRFDDGVGADAEEERIYEFGLKKRIRPKTLLMLDRNVETATNWARVAKTKPTSDPVFDTDTKKITPDILREDVYQVDSALRVGQDSEMATELERLRSGYLEARGRSDCRQLAPGYRFTLTSHPIDALNDTYTVTALDSEGIHPAFLGKDDATHVYRNRFRCIPFRFSPRPLRSKKRPKMGLEVAKVVGEEGKLITATVEANHCGYVRIRFRWDIANDGGTPKESYGVNEDADHVVRLPVVQPWAGAGYGAQFIPRQGMEVLVGFLEHQGERPIILGCISSEENMPPWSGEENDFQKVGIHSRSWPPGDQSAWSEISIDDRKDDELIYVQAQKNKIVYVKHDRTETVDNNEDITIHQNRKERVDHNEAISIGDNRQRMVGLTDSLMVGMERSVAVGTQLTTSVGKSMRTSVGSNQHNEVGESVYIHAGKNVVIEADSVISLRVGGNFIRIDESGIIEKGTTINLNSSNGGPEKGTKVAPTPPPFDEQICFTCESGPIANVPYILTLADGSVAEGTTDEAGNTERVVTNVATEITQVQFAPDKIYCCSTHAQHEVEHLTDPPALTFPLSGIKTNDVDVGKSTVSSQLSVTSQSRTMTDGEKAMAEKVFGKEAVDYKRVVVHNCKYFFLQTRPMTPNGEMYFGEDYKADFSEADAPGKHLFMHEMTHVWQYQLDYGVKWHGFMLQIPYILGLSDSYRYELNDKKKLPDFNMEQQGDILADYFSVSNGVGVYSKSGRDQIEKSERIQDFLDLLKKTLSEFILDPKNKKNLPK